MTASGTQFEIVGHGYAAVATEVGGTLRHLEYEGRPLIAGFTANEVRPLYRGALLAPWPNRLADGAYTFNGDRQQLPLNEPDRMTALHGLVCWLPWTMIGHTRSTVELRCRLHPRDGYPHLLELTVTYALVPDGLHCSLEARNAGSSEAPYGFAPHPYLRPTSGPVDDWLLHVPAERYLEVTPDRLLPIDLADVAGTAYDFRSPRRIGSVRIDHPYTMLDETEVRLVGPKGSGVSIRWDETCPWVQVHTADRPEPEYDRCALAVEPMTCPPDAFNSGIDLLVLAPGEKHRTTWTIGAI